MKNKAQYEENEANKNLVSNDTGSKQDSMIVDKSPDMNLHMPSDGVIDEDDLDMKKKKSKYEKRVEIQIKSLKMLMTKEYDKVMILNSIIYISAVCIYVLIGPEFFNLKDESWDAAQIVINSTQILLLLVFLFDNITQAIAYRLDCIRQPIEIIWNIIILAFIALSFLQIFVTHLHRTQIQRLS